MAFQITKNVHVGRDADGTVRHLRHLLEPYMAEPAELTAPTPRALAAGYIRDVAPIYKLTSEMLSALDRSPPKEIFLAQTWDGSGSLLRFAKAKTISDSTTISYVQTHHGLPVWEAGVSVSLLQNPLRVPNSVCTVHLEMEVDKPDPKSPYLPDKITVSELMQLLGLPDKKNQEPPRINRMRLLIYRYETERRTTGAVAGEHPEGFGSRQPTLPLPPVPDSLKAGRHYVVTEVLFTLGLRNDPGLHWRALIEVETGAVLYLRAFVSDVQGGVYLADPLTATGDVSLTPASPEADLNDVKTLETLHGLIAPAPGDPQVLEGEFLRMVDDYYPREPPPTEVPPDPFDYSATSDDFAAVNAYFHLNAMFRMVADSGVDMAEFWDGTSFPVPVDHRANVWSDCADGDCVNARGLGNATGDGSGGFLFALAEEGQPVGIAADVRVVIHEFNGHDVKSRFASPSLPAVLLLH